MTVERVAGEIATSVKELKLVSAVYGHDDHSFILLASDLVNGVLPNAPECKIFERGKRCRSTSELVTVKYSSS